MNSWEKMVPLLCESRFEGKKSRAVFCTQFEVTYTPEGVSFGAWGRLELETVCGINTQEAWKAPRIETNLIGCESMYRREQV